MLYSKAWYRRLQYSTPRCHAWFQTSLPRLVLYASRKLPIDQAKMATSSWRLDYFRGINRFGSRCLQSAGTHTVTERLAERLVQQLARCDLMSGQITRP